MTEDEETVTQAGGPVADLSRGEAGTRIDTGRPAARALGRKPGRRPKLSEQQRAIVVDEVLSGRRTAAQIARHLKVSEPTISRILAAHRAGAGSLEAGDASDPVHRRAERIIGILPVAALDERIAIVGTSGSGRPTPPRAWSSGCWTAAPASASSIRSAFGGG